jgi:hypothetical protein
MIRTGLLSVIGGLIVSVLLTFEAAAQQVEIEDTISNQIEAFKADNFEQAFSYATPTLRQLFQNPQNFERMVKQGYPMVWRPAEVRYLEMRGAQGEFWQKVQIIDAKGFKHLLLYRMQQVDSGWRIGGVQLLEAPGGTV